MTQSVEQDGGDLTQGSGKGRWGRVDGAERTPCVRTRGSGVPTFLMWSPWWGEEALQTGAWAVCYIGGVWILFYSILFYF